MKSPLEIKIGVIGCGNRPRLIVQRLLADTTLRARLRVTALFDPLASVTEAMRKQVAPEAKVFSSVAALLAEGGVDWVMIGSWNCFHADQVVAAFHAGKHVFAEKPLALSLEDCLRIAEAQQMAGGCHFFFGLVLRYAPFHRKIKELLEQGVVGRPVSFEFNETLDFNHGGYIHGNWRRHREKAGTHVMEKCCHDFDLMNWLLRSLPVRAASFGGKDIFRPENRALSAALGKDSAGRPAYRTWFDPEGVDPFTEGSSIVDNQVVILEYASGVRATFHTNCQAALPERRFYVLGTEGTLRADAISGVIEWQRVGFNTVPERIGFDPVSGHYGADSVMVEHLARTMVENEPPLATLDDGIRATVSCLGVDQSLDTGCITDFRPLWKQVGIDP